MRKRLVWQLLLLTGLFGGLLLFLMLPLPSIQGILFSPGTGVHQGKVNCIECHIPFSSAPSCNNIACHPTLQGSNKNITSFQFHKYVANQPCTICHTEHAGVVDNFAERQFSHELFNVAQSDCKTCHEIPTDSLHKGLAPTEQCTDCHITKAWQEANFSHRQLSSNQLNQCVTCHQSQIPTDKNHNLYSEQCVVCHQVNSWNSIQFKHSGIVKNDSNNCSLCHTAPNDNYHFLFTSSCEVCHSEKSWKSARFSHSGLSAQGRVSCGVCHQASGEGHKNTDLNCGRCHNTKSWGDGE